jgi:hypothetical protein
MLPQTLASSSCAAPFVLPCGGDGGGSSFPLTLGGSADNERRRSRRQAAQSHVTAARAERREATVFMLDLLDVSLHGFRAETIEPLVVGDCFTAAVPPAIGRGQDPAHGGLLMASYRVMRSVPVGPALGRWRLREVGVDLVSVSADTAFSSTRLANGERRAVRAALLHPPEAATRRLAA